MLFAYFGPETVLPLTSMTAMVVGFVLMFSRQISIVTRRLLRRARRTAGGSVARSAGARFPREGVETPRRRMAVAERVES